MAVFNKLNGFVEHLSEGVHNLGSDQLVLALSNTAPSAETTAPTVSTANCILSNVTLVSTTDLSGTNPLNITTTSSTQSSGTYRLVLADITLSSTGTVGPFRYIYLYNDTPTTPADPLIGYFDYGAGLTLNNGESLTIDFDQSSGALTLA